MWIWVAVGGSFTVRAQVIIGLPVVHRMAHVIPTDPEIQLPPAVDMTAPIITDANLIQH